MVSGWALAFVPVLRGAGRLRNRQLCMLRFPPQGLECGEREEWERLLELVDFLL